ncbi:MAG TPA: tail fiber domain-containing protein, partial [Rubrobacter sp.]|nr:tail fiber domain-containing protein [Rubrobacter sp.]
TIDASGNVGVGTTTPASGNKLDVAGNLRILTGSNPVRFTSAHSGFSNNVTNQAEISNDTGTFRSLMIVGNRSGNLAGPGLGRRVSVYDTLEVNGTLRMAIQGDILFRGGTDANHGIGWYGGAKGDRDAYDLGFANTTVDGPVVYGFAGGALGSTSGGQRIALSWNSAGNVAMPGSLVVNGTASKPGGGSWANSSDARLKKEVRPLDGALDRLSRLRGVSFEWKKPEEQGNLTGTQIGLVAQEVEEVFPEWVDTDHNGYKMLTIRGFEALTVEALKELVAENQILQEKNNELEDRIVELELSTAEAAERGAGNPANGSPK